MESTKIDVRIIVEVAAFVALETVLSNIKIYKLPYGGSITLGNMVPLFLPSFRREPVVGIFSGMCFPNFGGDSK